MVNYFYLKDGRVIKKIEELPDILENINDETFNFHVNDYKNDFATWIYYDFKNPELAQILRSIKSKEETVRALRAYLKVKELNQKNKETGNIEVDIKKENDIKNEIEINKKKETKEEDKNENILEEPITKNDKNENILEESKKIENKNENKSKNKSENIIDLNENPDEFFKKNPIIIEQVVEAKKENIVLEPLPFVDYDKDNPQKTIEIFKDNYAKAYQRMSYLRKSGFDTSLAEIMLFRVVPKIKLYESSNEEKDALTVKRLLNEAIEEINNLK